MDGDYILALLRELVVRRPDVRIVLMSATLDSRKFAAYFNGVYSISVLSLLSPPPGLKKSEIASVIRLWRKDIFYHPYNCVP